MSALGIANEDGAAIAIDLHELIGSHALAIANSGGGKSGLLRRLLETTHGQVQQLVIDPEDELYTLRERFNYVIAGGDGADVPATVAGAAGLALEALRHGFSLVVQLNDLGDDAPAFVGEFLGGLMRAPPELWRPTLVAIDELQRFAGKSADEASLKGVKDLVQRGRKRGFTLVGASLRITEIDPGVRGLVNNWILGRVGQTLDRNTMAEQLGFTPSEGRSRLRGMEKRWFWGLGPAIASEPVLFRVADVETTPVQRGQAKPATPPAPEALRDILQGLADTAPIAAIDDTIPEDPKAAWDKGSVVGRMIAERDRRISELEDENQRLRHDRETLDHVSAQALKIGAGMHANLRELQDLFDDERAPVHSERAGVRPQRVGLLSADIDPAPKPNASSSQDGIAQESSDLPPRRTRILDALSWLELYLKRKAVPRGNVAWLADTTPNSSTYEKDLSAMRTLGLIDYPGKGLLMLTGLGATRAKTWPTTGSRDELQRAIAAKLPPRRVSILRALWDDPDARSRSWLASHCGTSAGSSTFEKDLSAMRTLGLIDYPASGLVELAEFLR